jgi:N-methylhydantoinase A
VGFLTAPLAFDFVRSWAVEMAEIDWARANNLLAEMATEGEALLKNSGVAVGDISHKREVDMRYVGQGHEIPVPVPAGPLSADSIPALAAEFNRVYQELYERLGPPVPIEIINWRVVSSGPTPEVALKMEASAGEDVQKGSRQAYFPETGGFVDTPVYDRYKLKPDMKFVGPAIVEERESTVILGPDCKWWIDEGFNLVVKMPA